MLSWHHHHNRLSPHTLGFYCCGAGNLSHSDIQHFALLLHSENMWGQTYTLFIQISANMKPLFIYLHHVKETRSLCQHLSSISDYNSTTFIHKKTLSTSLSHIYIVENKLIRIHHRHHCVYVCLWSEEQTYAFKLWTNLFYFAYILRHCAASSNEKLWECYVKFCNIKNSIFIIQHQI